MLLFTLYTAESRDDTSHTVYIDPAAVIAVEEADRCPAGGGWYHVAVITLTTGDKYTVEDGGRTVARYIDEAKSRLEARGEQAGD